MAKLCADNYNVIAHCPKCDIPSIFAVKYMETEERDVMRALTVYKRIVYVFCQCTVCLTCGLATVYDRKTRAGAELIDFYPVAGMGLSVPSAVPADILAEFREAEQCASRRLNRAASALFRSVLEKALKANGYTKTNDSSLRDLQKRIDAAADDGVITDARRKRAHEEIRSLGNDVLHDDWRLVTDGEVETAHKYMQRVLEDLYDDRPTVEKILLEKKRIQPKKESDEKDGPPPQTPEPDTVPSVW